MTVETIMPVAPTIAPYAGFGGYAGGYAGRDDCLSEVMLANQISSATADEIAATWKASNDVINAVTQHGLRNNDAIENSTRSIEKGLCDIRSDIKEEGSRTRELLLDKFAALSLQQCENTSCIKEALSRQTIESLRSDLLEARLAAVKVPTVVSP